MPETRDASGKVVNGPANPAAGAAVKVVTPDGVKDGYMGSGGEAVVNPKK